MFGLILETERCRDGVEVVEGHFRPRTFRREKIRLVTTDLEDPIAIRFANARDGFVPLLSKYTTGALFGDGPYRPTPVAHPEDGDTVTIKRVDMRFDVLSATATQRVIRDKLLAAGGNDPIDALIRITEGGPIRPSVLFQLEGDKPLMFIQCSDLLEFMTMEIAKIALEGAKVATCERCHNLFLTGTSASRRSHAMYCSDRCRVAAMRARKKGSQ